MNFNRKLVMTLIVTIVVVFGTTTLISIKNAQALDVELPQVSCILVENCNPSSDTTTTTTTNTLSTNCTNGDANGDVRAGNDGNFAGGDDASSATGGNLINDACKILL